MVTKITESNNEFYETLFKEVSEILKTFVSTYITEAKGKISEKDSSETTFILVNDGIISVKQETGIITDIILNSNIENPYVHYNMGIPEEVDLTENKEIAIQLCQAYIDVGQGDVKGLEEYFGIIETITHCIDTNYQILPLVAQDGEWVKDEEPFIIDADTRIIKVPNNNCTYAVSGDDLAETIYFVIDRYFDKVDLTTKNIAVLSKINNQKILTPIILKDITSLPDKIIFGWPISKILTKGVSGTLEFSVRFYTLDGTETDYSLNTIPARLNIKSTLDFSKEDEDVIADNASERAKELLANADIKGTAAVKPPVFHLGEGERKILNLNDGSLQLNAAAHSLDALPISYYWTERTENMHFEEIEGSKNDDSNFDYIEIAPENLLKEIEKYGIFYAGEDKTQIDLSNEELDINTTYYRKGSSQIVDIAGQYQCVAIAKRGAIRQKAARSAIFEIPSPSNITLEKNRNYENKELKFFFEEGEDYQSDSVKTKLLNIIDTKYEQDDNNYKGQIKSIITQSALNNNYYTLTRENHLNNKYTTASFENIIIYDSLPIPSVSFNIDNIKDTSRDITISLNNFNPECMEYSIDLIRSFGNAETSVEINKPITIGQGVEYIIGATYKPKYTLLDGSLPTNTVNNTIKIESRTEAPPASASFII